MVNILKQDTRSISKIFLNQGNIGEKIALISESASFKELCYSSLLHFTRAFNLISDSFS